MSSLNERRAKYSRKFIPAVYASAAAALLTGQVQQAQAGVFEQTCNGEVIAMGSGALASAPLEQKALSFRDSKQIAPTSILEFRLLAAADTSDVPAGAALAVDAPPPSSICGNPPAGTTSMGTPGLDVIKALQSKLSLPAPQKLSRKLSSRQLEMRERAADVGLRFADAPGVQKANLETPVFIKLFTTLVHRESSFHPQAISPAGARGLGQLMPATARGLGESQQPNSILPNLPSLKRNQ